MAIVAYWKMYCAKRANAAKPLVRKTAMTEGEEFKNLLFSTVAFMCNFHGQKFSGSTEHSETFPSTRDKIVN